jgi:uncharacterized protein
VGRDHDVELVPFYRLHHRAYAAYWDVFTRAEYDRRASEIAAERERQRKLEQATVGFVAPGDVQAEHEVNQQGEDTSIVRADGRPGRRAGKWFAYDMPVDATRPVALVVTYNSDTRRARRFDIFVEGQRVAEQTIPEGSESRFFDVEYPIPAEIVRGRQTVNVRFQAGAGGETAPVFGVRIIRVGG